MARSRCRDSADVSHFSRCRNMLPYTHAWSTHTHARTHECKCAHCVPNECSCVGLWREQHEHEIAQIRLSHALLSARAHHHITQHARHLCECEQLRRALAIARARLAARGRLVLAAERGQTAPLGRVLAARVVGYARVAHGESSSQHTLTQRTTSQHTRTYRPSSRRRAAAPRACSPLARQAPLASAVAVPQ
jgi:hypothetical protein